MFLCLINFVCYSSFDRVFQCHGLLYIPNTSSQ
uniref:Uncharacterized protein n=1 Tax=Arundo donax TaxID=35708 RepID=A0A0A8ZC38_ARUDO